MSLLSYKERKRLLVKHTFTQSTLKVNFPPELVEIIVKYSLQIERWDTKNPEHFNNISS